MSHTFNQRRGKGTKMRDDFKAAMREWRTGMCLVTSLDAEGRPIGLICNSFASLSLAPPLISWAVDHGSSSIAGWRAAGSYALHVLPPIPEPLNHPLVAAFARRGGDKFAGLRFAHNANGDPVFPELPTRFDCVLHQRIEIGDHDLMVGRPTAITHPAQKRES
ncbi:flavin reductase (DIM6/NTAB) family NADH-FMN oxidoreductase RutF [Leucobacter luti]|uniref:Flavin reductase (DIM6/NTAB) family NADH-FMN oxidoreductase RutF n=2 Tax=Leucobacter luti TaxID=340320 RepID=A0A4Q7TY86_9MICO|nr:flavin reductase (DIM6/NTAB) family NADH-FMN oxidoreductase RutF [Leucobacter luti]